MFKLKIHVIHTKLHLRLINQRMKMKKLCINSDKKGNASQLITKKFLKIISRTNENI